jgi:hypothetical protein
MGRTGKQDGMYSVHKLTTPEKIAVSCRFLFLNNCSHNVFIDQQQHLTVC